MPDPALDTPEREVAEPSEFTPAPRDKPAIHDGMGYHLFAESEFPNGAGCCSFCGGGPDAPIHQKPVDQMERIADALERIADELEVPKGKEGQTPEDEIAEVLERHCGFDGRPFAKYLLSVIPK